MKIEPLSLNVKLLIAAVIIVVLTLLAGPPYHSSQVSVDPKELAYRVQHELDHITALELAQWIAAGKKNFRLIDLRDKEEFVKYHIPTAENATLASVVDNQFGKNDTVVLYSQGGVHAAQAMFLLWTQGHNNVYMLKGGISEWNETVLFPRLSTGIPGGDRDSVASVRELSKFFGGSPTIAPPHEKVKPIPREKEREKSRDEC